MGMDFVSASEQYMNAATELAALRATCSLSFWITTTQVGDDTIWMAPGISGIEQAGGDDDFFWGALNNNGGSSQLLAGRGNGSYVPTSQINTGAEFHVVFTYDKSTGLIAAYVNGVWYDDLTTGTADVTNTFSRIASIEDTGGTPTYLNGNLDDVRIYNRVLSANEIAALYAQRGADRVFYGLVHRWMFREDYPGQTASGAGQNVDEFGGNNGTPTNGPTFTTSSLGRRRVA